MEKIDEVYIILDDKPGSFGKMARILKKKRISIYGIGLFIDTARIHVSHPEKAVEALTAEGYQADLHSVLRVMLPNHAGALLDMTKKLGNADININYLSFLSETYSTNDIGFTHLIAFVESTGSTEIIHQRVALHKILPARI